MHYSTQEDQMAKKKKIAIISTGGTIAGVGKPGQSGIYQAGLISVDEIIDSVPEIRDIADLEVINVCSKDSNDIDWKDLLKIKETAERLEEDPNIDGIVITHGTDTMEETAFALNLILNVHKPVVITGAMRPATATSADGPMNLMQSIALACSPHAREMGVLAVISDTIYSGRDLTKVHSIKTDAFETAYPGPIGYMQDEHVFLLHQPYRRHTFYSRFAADTPKELPTTAIYYVHSHNDPELLKYMLEHYDGVVIAGSGSGNYSSAIQKVIEDHATDALIIRSSRLLEGAAFESPVFDPLQKTIPAHRLSPHKARILLEFGLAHQLSRKELARLYKEY